MGNGKGGSSWANACKFGAACKLSKRSKDKFCSIHSTCGWPTCGTKVLDIEGGNFLYSYIGHKQWFCRDHSCKAKVKDKQCYELRDKNSQYCEEHSKEFQCKMPKCDSDRDGSERYCKKHHCGVDDCHRRVLSLADDEMAGRDKKKCYKHQRCEASRDCKNYSLWDPDKTPTRLCANHSKCEFFQACNGFAQGDSRFCTDHECDQQGCLQPRDVHNGLIMRWCHMHLCSAPGCPDFANGHEQTVQKLSSTTIPTLISAKLTPAPSLHVPMSQQSPVDIALPIHAPPQAAVRPENGVLHSSPPFAHSMGTRERNNKRGTIIIQFLLLGQHLARVAGLVAMTPGACRGHFANSNTITQPIRIRFRPQKLIVDMRIIT
ncbi:uncharacterized protein FTJAE_6046 [Fusarium tjaetaba]|uniref:Uncharacterized protein n=1 Tax=Fusarium tjaetaba TaxID=1567544 RepID=A0A8H5RP38_9HYPO|nr:uncharacterized protein FTJAE_6046 [Fusarium tjaetaba]KAF5636525.1 hypothetical protein FTJAE_6046 [Fusarium tjaetaba]